MKIAVIAGTSDAVEYIAGLPLTDAVTAFVATPYGAEILSHLPCAVRVGRLDAAGFAAVLPEFDKVADVSHPFAVEVSANVRNACEECGIPYERIERPRECYTYEKIVRVSSKEQAAAYLNEIRGNVLLTTGGNTLAFYEAAVKDFAERGYVRILDTPESHKMVEHSRANIIYGKPPFTQADTEELIAAYEIRVLVTKESGKRGGVPEKVAAAKRYGIPVILIEIPNN